MSKKKKVRKRLPTAPKVHRMGKQPQQAYGPSADPKLEGSIIRQQLFHDPVADFQELLCMACKGCKRYGALFRVARPSLKVARDLFPGISHGRAREFARSGFCIFFFDKQQHMLAFYDRMQERRRLTRWNNKHTVNWCASDFNGEKLVIY